MYHRLHRVHLSFFKFRAFFTEDFLALLLAVFVFAVPAGATTRFENRGLTMQSATPGVVTSYTIALTYMTPAAVGSLDMLFCESPIPYEACVPPAGLDVSGATLSNQTGETGFSIFSKTSNHIILSRTPTMISSATAASTYTFDTMKNPTDTQTAFSIRLKSLGSTDGTGPQIDFGSVRGQVTDGMVLQTQVPPMLVFCVAQKVEDNCAGTNGNYFTDMGNLSQNTTLTAQSQMAVGTNASGGFVVTANGDPLAAGTNVIDGLKTPTLSEKGTNQFGINLVANDQLGIGQNPQGSWANAQPALGYGEPNKYKYVPGDVIASSPNVSLMEKFTISYIVNTSPDLRAGVYTTTINYVASGRF